jgi:hypothetical protein
VSFVTESHSVLFILVNYRYYNMLLITPWPESAKGLYRPIDRRMSAKIVPIFAYRGSHVVSVMDPSGRILGFLDRNRYFFFQVAPQLYSRG